METTDNMVLRTLYLPKELDQTLKAAAVRGGRSKGDVIRELIQAGLEKLKSQPGSYLAPPAPRDGGPVRAKVIEGRAATAAKPIARRTVKQKSRTAARKRKASAPA